MWILSEITAWGEENSYYILKFLLVYLKNVFFKKKKKTCLFQFTVGIEMILAALTQYDPSLSLQIQAMK